MKVKVKVKPLSRVRLFATPWTVAHQAPPSMGFSRQAYWSRLPFPSPGDLPNPRIKPGSPALRPTLYHLRCQFDPWIREDPLEEGMATQSSILAWRIPRTEEPAELQAMGSQRVRHDWNDLARMHACSDKASLFPVSSWTIFSLRFFKSLSRSAVHWPFIFLLTIKFAFISFL